MINEYKTLDKVKQNDVTVHRCFSMGLNKDQIIIHLANQKQVLLEQIMKLEAIAPRKIIIGNDTYIYHCPDHLIPNIKDV